MSRRSHAFAEGAPAFSWKVSLMDSTRGRYKCECKNHPGIVGWGDSEQTAILNARRAMEHAVDTVDNRLVASTDTLPPTSVTD